MKAKTKKIIGNLTKISISLLLLYLVFKKIPFENMLLVVKKASVFPIIVASFFFVASQIISTKRLDFYLREVGFNLTFSSNLKLYSLGMFYNFFIPGGIGGDAYKIYLLNKRFGWSSKKITSAIFNDRLSGLVAICILMVVLSFFILEKSFFPVLIGLLILGIFVSYFFVKKLFSIYKSIFFKTLIYSLMVQLLQVFCFIFLLKSIGLEENFMVYGILFLASSVLSLISFAGIGVREMLFLQASQFFEFQPEFSITASILFTLITAFFSFIGFYFQIRKLTLRTE